MKNEGRLMKVRVTREGSEINHWKRHGNATNPSIYTLAKWLDKVRCVSSKENWWKGEKGEKYLTTSTTRVRLGQSMLDNKFF